MKKLLPIFISVCVISLNMLCANASDNILRSVSVKSGANPDSGSKYNIELTSTAPARMTKSILSENRIILNLKDISLSSNVKTNFEGNSVIDNVMVEPHGENGVDVFLQGDNIAYSNIVFKEPSAAENVQDSVKSSFGSLFSILSGRTFKDRGVQTGILIFFLMVIVGEVKFIKSKYDELQAEKQKMLKDLERTKDFQDYLPGYGRNGLNKPYTTPIYSANVNLNVRKPALARLKTPETTTLNSLLYNRNRENKIIDRIVNNTPVFGTLSNIDVNGMNNSVSNPIDKSRLKTSIMHLEKLTKKFRSSANSYSDELPKRLNRIY